MADPRWEVRGKYKRSMVVDFADKSIKIDFTTLDGQSFDYNHLGVHQIWFCMMDDAVSAPLAIADYGDAEQIAE